MSKIVSFAGLIATFMVAYGLERLVTWLRADMGVTLAANRYLWTESVAIMILATTLMLLSWYVVFQSDRDVLVAAVFVLVGLGATFAVAIEMSLGLSRIAASHMGEFLWPDSYVRYAAAFVAVIGIASLLVRRPLSGAVHGAPSECLRGPDGGGER